jgi:hypothetical protein
MKLQSEMNALMAAIKLDFLNNTPHHGDMYDRFDKALSYTVGKKYIKIQRLPDEGFSNQFPWTWGFVVLLGNDPKFKRGDILQSDEFEAPRRDSARGNILDGGYTVRWCNPELLN